MIVALTDDNSDYTALTDEALLSLSARHRDEQACEELVKRYADQLFRFVKGKLGVPRQDAEDLCQEVWLKIWNIRNFRDNYQANCTAYIYKTTRNITADYWKSRNRRQALITGEKAARELFTELGISHAEGDTAVFEPVDPQPEPGAFVDASEKFARLVECWEQLSVPKREVILMSRFEGKMSLKQIAEIVEESTDTVKSRLRNGLRDLVNCMGELLIPKPSGADL